MADNKPIFIHYDRIANLSPDSAHYLLEKFREVPVTVEHKLDGSNMQIIFVHDTDTNTVETKYASRNLMLEKDTKEFKFMDSVKEHFDLFERIKTYMVKNKILQINLYGELYGCLRCADRIKYFEVKPPHDKLKFFAMKIDGLDLTPERFYSISDEMNIPTVERLGVFKLIDAVKFDLFDENLIKRLTHDKVIEGIVLKCYGEKLFDHVKIKNPRFAEIEAKKKRTDLDTITPPSPHMQDFEEAHELFIKYITENRLINVFNKQPYSRKDTQQLCNRMIEDALEDFYSDHPDKRELINLGNCRVSVKCNVYKMIKSLFQTI